MQKNNAWGSHPGWANSFGEALSNYNHGQLNSSIARGGILNYYAGNYAGKYDISVSDAHGQHEGMGFNVNYNYIGKPEGGDFNVFINPTAFWSTDKVLGLFGAKAGDIEKGNKTLAGVSEGAGLVVAGETGAEGLTKMTYAVTKQTMGLVGKNAMKTLKTIGKFGAWAGVGLAAANYAEGNINLGHAIINSAASLATFIPFVGPVISIGWGVADSLWGNEINNWFE